ncbi:two-partner secretion domain-containing protein [Glacieibacterium frigidum]|nr:hypothetical protein [Glacieibacterium frigidum]
MASRHRLLARTALGSVALLAAGPGFTLPGSPVNVAVNPGGTAPVITNPNASTLDIDFNAARTVLQYNGFTVGQGETVNLRFDARSDIGVIHNVGQEALSVDGVLRSYVGQQFGGNVWLLSSTGVFFGANAQVDVGGLVASTAIPTNLLSTQGGFLDTTTLSFDFANGAGQVTVGEGARITGNGGSLAFIAPSVRTGSGSTVGGGGNTSVLYGAAERFTVRFVREAGNDLDLLDFEVPGLSAGSDSSVPLSILGTTQAGNIYLASVGKVATVSAVLSVDASLIATSAGVEGGSIVLTSGGGIANRAAAPVFTDGYYRQSIDARGDFIADRSITAQATGDVFAFGNIRATTGSIRMTGTTVHGFSLTAGQDIVLRAGDALGSTAGYGYGYGYGQPYGPQGGFVGFDIVSAGDDVLAVAWNGDVSLNSVLLAGTGPDAASDPLGLDAANDGRRLLMRTTGDFGDVRLGFTGEGTTNALTGGTEARLESTGLIRVVSSGAVTLTEAIANGTGSSNLDFTEFATEGALNIGSVTAKGAIVATSSASVTIGSATTSFDSRDNGQIAVRGGTTATLTSADAASDVIVIANGDATVGTVRAGDDVIVRAFGGTARLNGARVATGDTQNGDEGEGFYGPDSDGNLINTGYGYGYGYGFRIFGDLDFDSDFNGRRVDLRALTLFQGEGVSAPGLDAFLGLGTGRVIDATDVRVEADRDAFIDLLGDARVDNLVAGRNVVATGAEGLYVGFIEAGLDAGITARAGDAYVSSGGVGRDLTITAPGGEAGFGEIGVGQDLLLSGVTASLGFLGGYQDAGGPRDVTVRTTGGDIFLSSLDAGRDIVLDAVGDVDAFGLDAGGSIRVTATGDATFGLGQFGRGEPGQILADLDLTVTAANILIRPGTSFRAGRDATLTATSSVDIQTLAEAGDDFRVTAPTIVIDGLYAGSGEGTPGPDSEGDGRNIVLAGTTIDAIRLIADTDVRATATGRIGIGDANCEGECDPGIVRAGRDVLLSGASFRLDAPIDAGRDASLSSTTGSLDLSDEDVDADRDLILTSTGGIILGLARAERDLRLTAATSVDADELDAGRDIRVSGADIRLGRAYSGQGEGGAGSIVLTGGTITAADLDANNGDVRATATGALTISQSVCSFCQRSGILADGDIVLSAASIALEGALDAGRDLNLTTTGAGFTRLVPLNAGQDVIVDAAGALDLGPVSAGRDVVLTGASVSVNQILPGRDARVTARTGNAVVGTARTPRDLTVLAAMGLASIGTANVGGKLLLSGATVALGSVGAFVPAGYGYGYGTPVPTFDITIAATAGGFSYGGTLAAANDLRITVSGALALSGTTTAVRDIVLDGGSVTVAGASAGRDLGITARTGALTASAVLAAGDDVRLTGPSIDVGEIIVSTAKDDTEGDGRRIVLAGGSATLTGATAPDRFDATLTGTLTTGTGTVTAAAIRVDAGAITRTVPSSSTAFAGATGVVLNATGAIDTGGVTSSGGTVAVDAGGALRLRGGVSAPVVTLAGASVQLNSNVSGAQLLGVTARSGDVNGGSLDSDGDVTVTASGGIALSSARAGDDIVLTAGGPVTVLGSLVAGLTGEGVAGADSESDGQNIRVTGGAVTLATLDAPTDAVVTGDSVAISYIGTRRDTIVTARTGDALVSSAAVRRDLRVLAANGLARIGFATVGRDLLLSGLRAQLGGLSGYLDGYGYGYGQLIPTRDITILATAGDFAFADTLAADRDLDIRASGLLTLGTVTARDDVRLGGGAVTVATARALGGTDSEGDGSNLVVTAASLNADVLSAATDVRINTSGAATLAQNDGGVDARDIIVDAGALTTGRMTATHDLRLNTSGNLTATASQSAGRDALIDAGGTAAMVSASSVRDFIVTGASLDLGTVSAGRDLTATARTGVLQIGTATAGGDLRLAGPDVRIVKATSTGAGADTEGDGSNIVATGGAVRIDGASAATDLAVTATGLASVGAAQGGATAGQDIILNGATLEFGNLVAARDLSLTATAGGIGETVGLNSAISAGRDLRLDAAAGLTAGALSAVRDLTVIAAAVTIADLGAGRDASVIARSGAVNVGTATAGDDLRFAGATVAIGNATTTGAAADTETDGSSIVATGGDVRVDRSSAFTDLIVTATGTATVGGGDGGARAARDIAVSGATLVLGTLDAGRDLSLIATASGFSAGTLTAVRNLTVDAAGPLSFASADAGGNLVLSGAGIDGGSATAGGDATLDARTGTLRAGLVRAGDDVRLAGATIDVEEARSTGLASDSEGDGSDIVATGGAVTLEIAVAANDILATGSGVVALGIGSDGSPVGGGNVYFADAGGDIVVSGASVLTGPLNADRDIRLTATAGGIDARGTLTAGRDIAGSATGAVAATGLDATRDIVISGASANLGQVAARQDVRVTAIGGDAVVGSAAVRRDLTVLAALGLAQVGDAAVGQDFLLSGARVALGSLSGYTNPGYGYGYGYGYGLIPTRDVTLTATAGDITGGASLRAARDMRITASGAIALGNLTAGALLDANAGGALGTGALGAGGDLRLAGASLATGDASAGGDLTATARTGNATLGNVSAGDDVRISALLDLTLGSAGATGNATDSEGDGRNVILDGRAVTLVSATATDDVRITATGALTVTGEGIAIAAGRDAILVAPSLSPGGISAGRDLSLTATASGIAAGDLSAARDLTLDAAGALTFGNLNAARDLSLAGASVAGGVVVAGGDLNATARSGALALTRATAGNDVRLTGAIIDAYAVAGRDLFATGGAVTLGGEATRDIGVIGTGLTLRGPDRQGDAILTAGDDVRIAVGSGAVTGQSITAGGGADSEGDGGNVVIDAGSIVVDAVFATTDVVLTSAGALTTGGGISAGRDVLLTAASLAPGSISAGRDLVLTATAGDIAAGDLSAARDLIADATGTLGFGSLTATRDLVLTGASLDGDAATAGRDVTVTARSGNAVLADTRAGDDVRVTAAQDATLGAVVASGAGTDTEGDGSNIAVAARGITLTSASAPTDIRLTATGALSVTGTGTGVVAGRDVVLVAASLAPSGISAGRDLSLTATAGDIVAGDLTSARDLIADASGALRFGGLTAARDLILTGASLDGSGATAGGDVTATARSGGIVLADTRAGDDVRVTAAQDVTLGGVAATGEGLDSEGDGSNIVIGGRAVSLTAATAPTDVRVVASGALTIASAANAVVAGRDAILTGATVSPGGVSAGRDLIFTATEGGIAAGDVSAARDLIADAAGALTFGTLTAARDLVLTGASLNGGTARAGGDVTATARSGGIVLGNTQAGDDVRLSAVQDVALGGVVATGLGTDSEADGSNVIIGGRDVTLVSASAPGDVRITASGALGVTGEGNAISAGRDAVLSAASLSPAGVSAGRDVSLTATASGFTGGTLGAVRNLTISAAGPLSFGTATAGGALTLTATSIAGTTATAGTDLTATATDALSLTSATAGDDVRLTGGSQSLGQVRATGLAADSEGDGSNVVLAGGAITAAQLSAANDIGVTGTGAVSIAQASASRDVTVTGASVGGALQLSGRDIAVTTGGAFAATAGLVATRDLRLTAGTTLSFAQLTAARDLILTAPIVQGGTAVATRDLTVVATTRIAGDRFEAGRNLSLDPDEAITAAVVRAGGDATLIGRSIDVGTLDVGGVTFAQATNGGIALDTFTGRGAATLIATGRVSLGASTTGALRIVGGDLDVRRSLVASALQVETPGRMVLGGAEGDSGFVLAAADIARLRIAGTASFYAALTTGQGDGQGAGGDLIVRDFGYNPADLPRLALFADRSHAVDVQGRVLPSVNGGFIQIGDANPLGRFRPDSVFVSGSFGFAELDVNCFGKVVAVGELAFYAVNDVIFGLADFRAAVRATPAADIDVAGGVPAVAGPRDDRLFAVANRFTVDAAGKIVSQNTASSQGNYVGLFFNGTGASQPIVSLGNARAIDLSGSLVDSAGNLRSGPTVAFAGELGSGNGGTAIFNGCAIGATTCGGGGSGATPSEALRLEDYTPPRPIDITDQPLSTVLIVDQQPGATDTYVVEGAGGGIVIRRRPGGN